MGGLVPSTYLVSILPSNTYITFTLSPSLPLSLSLLLSHSLTSSLTHSLPPFPPFPPFPPPSLTHSLTHSLTPPQALEELIEKEAKRMVRIKSRFPVLHASRLKELMDESKLSQKMNRAELEQVC